jgi:site-specific DNA-cytosine methylase
MVLIEEVPDFLKSGAYFILKNVLQRLNYNVDARVIDPVEYGELTRRRLAVIVACTGVQVEWPAPVIFNTRTMADILDPVETGGWFTEETKPWLFEHWRQHAGKGNGFAPSEGGMQQIVANSPCVGTITKRYFSGQGQNPVVLHPTEPDTYRWLSLDEVKRLHGIRPDYELSGSKTRAGELIGQGVVVSTMQQIIAVNLPTFPTA